MRDWLGAYGVLQLGWTVALLLLVPTALGVVVDLRLDTAPWGTVAGTLVAVTAATYGITRTIQRRYARLAPSRAGEGDL